MAIKTFTAGSVLTAADTNTYLTNSGLVYISEAQAVSTSVLNILGCFSLTYENYRIIGTEMRSTSTGTNIFYRFLTGSTPDTSASYSWGWSGISTLAVNTNYSAASQTAGWFSSCFSATETGNGVTVDVLGPRIQKRTVILGNSENLNGGLNGFEFRSGGGLHDNALTQFTGIQFYASAGNLSGKFKIYGYRQA
jgi:hypothetical protein